MNRLAIFRYKKYKLGRTSVRLVSSIKSTDWPRILPTHMLENKNIQTPFSNSASFCFGSPIFILSDFVIIKVRYKNN